MNSDEPWIEPRKDVPQLRASLVQNFSECNPGVRHTLLSSVFPCAPCGSLLSLGYTLHEAG